MWLLNVTIGMTGECEVLLDVTVGYDSWMRLLGVPVTNDCSLFENDVTVEKRMGNLQ